MNLWGAKYARSVKKCPPPETLSGGGAKFETKVQNIWHLGIL